MNLKSKIQNDLIDPNLSQIYSSVTGTIIGVNKIKNLANVSFVDPRTGVKRKERDLNIPFFPNMSTAGPYVGTKVIISFSSKNCDDPRIVSLISPNYAMSEREQNLRHSYEGTYLPDSIQLYGGDEESPQEVFNLYDNLTSSDTSGSQIMNPEELFDYMDRNIEYFDSNEMGFIHPITKSMIKIKDDGNIDIFTIGDNGIRINKTLKSIVATSNVFKAIASEAIELVSAGVLKLRSIGEMTFSSSKSITQNADADINLNSSRVMVNGKQLEEIMTSISTDITNSIVGPIEKELKSNMSSMSNTISSNYSNLNDEINDIKRSMSD